MRRVLWMSALLMLLSGCTAVQPWERGTLAEPGMELGGDPVDGYVDNHIYFSREAAVGSGGVGGGGCGCN
ncbi:DUF4266 domain-containing protein [Saccharospirillum mangrovi]|uniref:DUF4266 domain-containing protein n=1 Tax=Saccharospirillum mangrovi TaxID=2161747 RepID=UPI000D38F05C|nr:DUF4266 domain-containing protein [Saccharospirillum mangrovi]